MLIEQGPVLPSQVEDALYMRISLLPAEIVIVLRELEVWDRSALALNLWCNWRRSTARLPGGWPALISQAPRSRSRT